MSKDEVLIFEPGGSGHVIKLPKDKKLVEAINYKLDELVENIHPWKDIEDYLDLLYMIYLLEPLVSFGSIDAYRISEKIYRKYGRVHAVIYSNSVKTVMGYVDGTINPLA